MLAGDIESNPGPEGSKQRSMSMDQIHSGQVSDEVQVQHMKSFHQDMLKSLNEALCRMEANQVKHAEEVEGRLKEVADSFTQRLSQVEEQQSRLAEEVTGMRAEYEELSRENLYLKQQLDDVVAKCDVLENHSRRNNLIFFGLEQHGRETWEDCEAKVREVIREGMGISDFIDIERAHRMGRAIIVKLLSYKQKALILQNSRKLRNSQYFQNTYVKEDFSEAVRVARKHLGEKKKELNNYGQEAKLRFNKLITSDSVYSYDYVTGEVKRKINRKDMFVDKRVTDDNDKRSTKPQSPSNTQDSRGRSQILKDKPMQDSFLLFSSEYPDLHQTTNRPSMSDGEGAAFSAIGGLGCNVGERRVSGIPVPTARSPVKTRQRARAESTDDRTADRDKRRVGLQGNTLQNWVTSTDRGRTQRTMDEGRGGARPKSGKEGKETRREEGGGRGQRQHVNSWR